MFQIQVSFALCAVCEQVLEAIESLSQQFYRSSRDARSCGYYKTAQTYWIAAEKLQNWYGMILWGDVYRFDLAIVTNHGAQASNFPKRRQDDYYC